jgi:hypothetical protein
VDAIQYNTERHTTGGITMDCDKCKYYDTEEGVCTAFECNGTDCPKLPCEEYWIFTFGCGQEHAGRYVKIRGTFNQARQKMMDRYGEQWGFQYSEEKWEEMKNNPNRCWPMETELETIE